MREARVGASVGASWGGETRRFLATLRGRLSVLLRLDNASRSREGVEEGTSCRVTLIVGAPERGS